jgi:hypothetical protein
MINVQTRLSLRIVTKSSPCPPATWPSSFRALLPRMGRPFAAQQQKQQQNPHRISFSSFSQRRRRQSRPVARRGQLMHALCRGPTHDVARSPRDDPATAPRHRAQRRGGGRRRRRRHASARTRSLSRAPHLDVGVESPPTIVRPPSSNSSSSSGLVAAAA